MLNYDCIVQWDLSNPDTLGDLGQTKVSLLVRCPDFRGCNVHKQSVWDSKMCPVYLRCPHFRVSYL